MISTDAVIWKEGDVHQEGTSVETVLHAFKERGARATLAVIDASRRNPYECRFRSYSHGLAPVNAPNNALVISSNTPGEVADATKGEHSVFVTELLNELNAPLARKASSTGPASPSFALPMARRYRRYPPRSWRTCTSVPAMIPIWRRRPSRRRS